MIGARRRRRGYLAALLHRLSGLALALFLPLHFMALGTALNGANALDSFLSLTHNPIIKFLEWGIVTALALHMALGLRVLAIEWLAWRERSAIVFSGCLAGSAAVGLIFLLGG